MAEQVVGEKSDDLDIVSTGKLYQGPWEKKYWSSSRGKDRHPYPVGYVAHRTYNGTTYKMAILEGLKGPEFAISSTDGESCSGQTPDIAWEGFQKKSCVRIKFWRGKRFSCKIDGAELFGFKNPHVTRLLRGLKANASPISVQSLPSSCFGNEQSEVNLVKTEGKEKRSKKRKEGHVKSVSGTQHKRERSQEDGLQSNSSISSENLEKEKCLAVLEASNSIGSKDLIPNEENIIFSKNQENLDASFASSKTADEKGNLLVQKGSQILNDVDLYAPDTLDPALADEKRDVQVNKDSQMLHDVDLCAPDTLDPVLDTTCNQEVKIHKESSCSVQEKLNAAQISSAESQSKDDTVIATVSDNSYKSDSDSIGQEITNSMMTLLLPRALPLLKTYSRKKKKAPCKISQEQKLETNQSMKDETQNLENLLIEKIELGKQNENVVLPSTDTSSVVPCLDDSEAIAPDSFENQQCEFMECSQDIVKADCGVELSSHEQVCHVGKTMSKMKTKTNQDVDLVFYPSGMDPQLTDVKISPCHVEGTITTIDAKSTSPVGLISTQCEMTKLVHEDEEVKAESISNNSHNDELQNVFELVGCYVHPTPISMVMLRTKGNEVFICVLSGYLMEKDRTLFVYKTSIKGETRGHPSFIGHTKITSPNPKNTSGDQIMQFTPDGKFLVLLNDIKAPYCREGGVKCQYSACTPDCLEKKALKIVQVKIGHVHVVCKLKTTNNICCILVCEPSHLVAAEESGRINLWTMNSTWSSAKEQCYLPTSDCMPNSIIEMKRIPNFPALVVSHSAFGEFCLWDLSRKIMVSKFSASGTSFLHFLPLNLFKCLKSGCMKKEAVDMMEETQRWFIKPDNHEHLALVLLVSSLSNRDHNYKDSGCWSLALLAKNKLILLNDLDPSATVAGASAGYGIIGTRDGSLYIWELSTGTNLGYLSHSRGATVSCLAADDSDSGAFAVAVDGSQLQVYARNKNHR